MASDDDYDSIAEGSDTEPAPTCNQASGEPLHVVSCEESSCADDAQGISTTGATFDSRPRELSIPQYSLGAGQRMVPIRRHGRLRKSEHSSGDKGSKESESPSVSVAQLRWSKLRANFRLAALRSIAQDKRDALKKLQEVRKQADKAQEAQSDSRTCKICWDRATNTVCLDCGHQCMCTRCGSCMTFCPICMQDISELVELQ